MDPEMRAKFIQVTDLLRCIGDGVGQANAGLWRYSASCVGMLAVKTARVTVDFEMTSEAVADTYGLPGPLALGAKTIYLTSASKEEREINRAQITLEIVSVAPEAPPPGEGASAPGGVAPEAPSAKDVQHKQNLLHMTKVMRAKILSTKRLSDKNRQTLAEGLDAAARLVHECRDKEACYLLLKVALKFQEELTQKDSPDKEPTQLWDAAPGIQPPSSHSPVHGQYAMRVFSVRGG